MLNWILKRIGNLIGLLLIIAIIVWCLFIVASPCLIVYWIVR